MNQIQADKQNKTSISEKSKTMQKQEDGLSERREL